MQPVCWTKRWKRGVSARLGEIIYLYLAARYEKVRIDGQIRDVALLIAAGIDAEGKRRILGVSVSLREAQQHWRAFLEGLIERGLRALQLVISDDHSWLRKARQAVFTGIPWQINVPVFPSAAERQPICAA